MSVPPRVGRALPSQPGPRSVRCEGPFGTRWSGPFRGVEALGSPPCPWTSPVSCPSSRWRWTGPAARPSGSRSRRPCGWRSGRGGCGAASGCPRPGSSRPARRLAGPGRLRVRAAARRGVRRLGRRVGHAGRRRGGRRGRRRRPVAATGRRRARSARRASTSATASRTCARSRRATGVGPGRRPEGDADRRPRRRHARGRPAPAGRARRLPPPGAGRVRRTRRTRRRGRLPAGPDLRPRRPRRCAASIGSGWRTRALATTTGSHGAPAWRWRRSPSTRRACGSTTCAPAAPAPCS